MIWPKRRLLSTRIQSSWVKCGALYLQEENKRNGVLKYKNNGVQTQLRASAITTTTFYVDSGMQTASVQTTEAKTTEIRRPVTTICATYDNSAVQTIEPRPSTPTKCAITPIIPAHIKEPWKAEQAKFAIRLNLAVQTTEPRPVAGTRSAETAKVGVQTHTEEAETNGAIIAQIERLASENAELRTQLEAENAERTGSATKAQVGRLSSENAELRAQLEAAKAANSAVAKDDGQNALVLQELEQYKSTHASIKVEMQQASAKFDAMTARADPPCIREHDLPLPTRSSECCKRYLLGQRTAKHHGV
jgi:hypothetical protein